MFYIETQTNPKRRFVMDIENNVTLSSSGQPTAFRIESNYDVSDHYHQPFDRITAAGKVVAAKMNTGIRTSTSLEDFKVGMLALKKSGELFTVSFDDVLDVFKDCVFRNLTFTHSTPNSKYTLMCNMEITSQEISQQAALVEQPNSGAEYEAVLANTNKNRSYTTEAKEEDGLLEISDRLTGLGVGGWIVDQGL